ncbi:MULTISPECIES: MobF family relaxase [Cyanophyceae]|uniref:MobF family relaxase n=1 Tax=Cyanophyceae TaxID=3028117 RepID=UPI0024113CDA|nr:MobF family relaxase [Nodosilinea sp. FACHB-131]
MLTVSSMTAGQENYYCLLAQEDYYLAGGEPPGIWHGRGLAHFGISGVVDKEQFRNLFRGFSPDGERKLVSNAGKKNHRSGVDLVFSLPKSASILWGLGSQWHRQEIRDGGLCATKRALEYLEDSAFIRRGKGGVIKEKASIVAAIWEHGTSRAQDPNLHFHATVLNVGVRDDGKTWALETKPFFERKMAGGALFRAELAHQLRSRLGLKLVRKRSWFEVDGVPSDLIERFSTRRKEILQALGISDFSREHGTVVDAKLAAVEAVRTRKKKTLVARDALHRAWHEVCRELGYDPAQLAPHYERYQRTVEEDKQTLSTVIGDLTRWDNSEGERKSLLAHESYFSEPQLVRRVAEEVQVLGIGADAILTAVGEFLRSTGVVALTRGSQELYTTEDVLKVERELLDKAEALQANHTHSTNPRVVDRVVASIAREVSGRNRASAEPRGLSDEQERALRHITETPQGLALVVGAAGAGKTFMLNAARMVWEKEGYRVIGAAVAAKAAGGLKEGARIERSMSIAKLLKEIQRGNQTVSPNSKGEKGISLDSRTILLIDEAGMVGTRQMAQLVSHVHRAGAKLVLVGDPKQLQPIDAGGPFPAFQDRFGAAELRENRRQVEEWTRESVDLFRTGHAEAALEQYEARGMVVVRQNRMKAIESLIADWAMEARRNPRDHLMIAATNEQVTTLNRRAQQERFRNFELGLGFLRVGKERFHVGERVLFTENSYRDGVFNGDLGTVKKINPLDRKFTIKLDSGKTVEVNANRYKGLKLGYAITTHKAQGMTIKRNAYVLVESLMQELQLVYVQATRAKEKTKFYVDKPTYQHFRTAASQGREKRLATSVLNEKTTQRRHEQSLEL